MQLRDLFDVLPQQGEVVPLALQQLLRSDLDIRSGWRQAETLLLEATEALPDQLELRVALYKLYAYSNRFEAADALIQQVLEQAATAAGFSANWRQLSVSSACWSPAVGNVRYFLYSLKAAGFVRLRCGDVQGALAILEKLMELDPQDQVGGSVVLDIARGCTQ